MVVLDLQLPDLPGVEVARGLAASDHPPRVLVLSASGEQEDVLEAVKAGATGYLVKSASREEFLDAVRRTADGRAGLHPRAGRAGARRVPPAGHADAAADRTGRGSPSGRPRCCGWSPRACPTSRSPSGWCSRHRTVQNHVQNTLGKLQLHNRVELVRYAIEQGLDEA